MVRPKHIRRGGRLRLEWKKLQYFKMAFPTTHFFPIVIIPYMTAVVKISPLPKIVERPAHSSIGGKLILDNTRKGKFALLPQKYIEFPRYGIYRSVFGRWRFTETAVN